MLSHWLRTLLRQTSTKHRTSPPSRPKRGYRASLESLEERATPALTVTDLSQSSVHDLVSRILGTGITVSNVRFQGKETDASDAGLFDSADTDSINMPSGIVLSTGKAKDVEGPNTTLFNANNLLGVNKTTALGLTGDSDLNKLTTNNSLTYDAAVLEFDFVPRTSTVQLKYVFGSEEYPEFVNSPFIDNFIIAINGTNQALIPGSSTPLGINSMNNFANTQLFHDNQPNFPFITNTPFDTALDGFSSVMTINANVNAGRVNHIKIAIADTADQNFDSAIFIGTGSFQAIGVPANHNMTATGADFGGAPHIRVEQGLTGTTLGSFFAYDPAFLGGVRTAIGDVNGDGSADVVTAAGPSGGPHVKVFDGTTIGSASPTLLYSFFAFSPAFTGGLNLAVGDLDSDGTSDIIVGADQGPGSNPHVRVFSGANLALMRDFFAFAPGFNGGVRVASGDIDGDGYVDIITGAGPGAAPHVRAFSGFDGGILQDFFAFGSNFNGGVYVATGDFQLFINDPYTTKTHRDIVVSAGPGANPHVRVFDGLTNDINREFFASILQGTISINDGEAFRSGVRVATTDMNADGIDEIITTFGFGGDPVVKTFDYTSTIEIGYFFAYDGRHRGGVNIAGLY